MEVYFDNIKENIINEINCAKFSIYVCVGYFGVMTPPVSVKLRHFERFYNYKKN